jgi:hypothetical protein
VSLILGGALSAPMQCAYFRGNTEIGMTRKVELDVQLVVRVPRSLREAAEAAAERERRPLAQKLRNLIEDGLAGQSGAAA